MESDVVKKTKEEIIQRAVCLLCFVDRCALEGTVFDGVFRSLTEREDQRKIIIKWLKEKEYYSYLTAKERQYIETPVIQQTNDEIHIFENDYYSIEPLLWSLGLVNKLADYNNAVKYNLHLPLKIGPAHSFGMISDYAKMRSFDEINKQREITMLWYWRSLECRNYASKTLDFKEAINKTFGNKYTEILKDYKYFDQDRGDFIVSGKCVSKLSDKKQLALEIIAEKRFYAYEWLFSDEDWDEVDLVC